MSTHLINDPAAAPTLLDPDTHGAWLTLSAAVADEVPVIADREDLLVAVAPGLGHGAPACFLPPTATIEVDGTHLGPVDPATATPHRLADRTRYPVAWGLLTHECAHARHSHWEPSDDAPAGAAAAAELLEEPRVEAAQIRRRPDDRHWLRASALHLVLADTAPNPAAPATATSAATPAVTSALPGVGPETDPGAPSGTAVPDPAPPAPPAAAASPAAAAAPGPSSTGGTPLSRGQAARAAALVLARVDAGILTEPEAAPVAAAVTTLLGADTVARLRVLWKAAIAVPDDDADTMIDLGRRWCEVLGVDPATDPTHPTDPGDPTATAGTPATRAESGTGAAHSPPAPPLASPTGPSASLAAPADSSEPTADATAAPSEAPAEAPAEASGEASGKELAGALAETAERVWAVVAREPLPADPTAHREIAGNAERSRRQTAQRRARAVFTRGAVRVGGVPAGQTRISGTRPPTDAERAAARSLARVLSTAGVRDRVATRTTSALPPGRLRMRGALAADAQRAAGAVPTAEPFTRTTRRTVPTPPLRLGIGCDVSGSMGAFAGPVASAAWILAHAAHHATVPATTATVIFGRHVRAVTLPGTTPAEVTEFDACDNYEAADIAIDALDGALDLAGPGAARLLVIVSDGQFRPDPCRAAQARIDRLRGSGCAVLWLVPGSGLSDPLDGVTVHPITDPATAAAAIGRAATTALRTH